MKKTIWRAAALLLPLTLLCACSEETNEKKVQLITEQSGNASTSGQTDSADGSLLQATVIDADIQSAGVYSLTVNDLDDPTGVGYFRFVAENVTDNIYAGDTVSISYDGDIMEIFPAQLGEVYSVSVVESAPETQRLTKVISVTDTEIHLADDDAFALYNFYTQPRYTLPLSLFETAPATGDAVLVTYSGQLEQGNFKDVTKAEIVTE